MENSEPKDPGIKKEPDVVAYDADTGAPISLKDLKWVQEALEVDDDGYPIEKSRNEKPL